MSHVNHLHTLTKHNIHFRIICSCSFWHTKIMLCGGEKATPFTDVSSGYVNQILWPIFDVISYLKWDHVKKMCIQFYFSSLSSHAKKDWKRSRKCWLKIILFSWHWSLRKRKMLKHYSFSIQHKLSETVTFEIEYIIELRIFQTTPAHFKRGVSLGSG